MFEDNMVSLNKEKDLLDADVYQYNTLSDGIKKVYTNDDELIQYGDRGILDPNDVSFFNLFINGVLQPKVNYELQKGYLLLKTEDVPIKNSSIIISFITFVDKKANYMHLNSAQAEGIVPSGVIFSSPATDISISVQDHISNFLHLENTFLCGPESIPSGCNGTWEFTLTISNRSNISIANIVVKNTILLDLITAIENTLVFCGSTFIKDGVIIWDVGTLNPSESATANFRIEGFFQAAGSRYIGRSMAHGNAISGSVSTDIICIKPVHVSRGLALTQTITAGPINVKVHKANRWRIQITISNQSTAAISDILIRDILYMDYIKCTKIISISHGAVNRTDHELLWEIDALRELETAVLMIDIIGCYCRSGFRTLGIAAGVGSTNTSKIFSNISEDFQIIVSPKRHKQKKQLLLQAHVLHKTMKSFLGHSKKWTFSLNVTNTDYKPIDNLIVIDYILLDEVKNITIKSITCGKISVSEDTIIWKIEELPPYTTLTAIIEVAGSFNTIGCRLISRAIAAGTNSKSCVISNITSGCPVKVLARNQYTQPLICQNRAISSIYDIFVLKACLGFFLEDNLLTAPKGSIAIPRNNKCPDIFGDLMIEKYMVSGPLEVSTDKMNTWRVEIRISNFGYGPVHNVIMTDTLLVDELTCFTPINFTKGAISQKNNIITWNIGTINSRNTVVLLAEVSGYFHKKNNTILTVSDYQYNAISNGIKKEFTNADELVIYGNYGIPNPNDISFFNLYLNGVLQPETNYFVDTGILTLTIEEAPLKNAAVILEYLIIKDKNEQLLKAETYQYNTLSNGGKTYTDADELADYGNQGILDPEQTSYNTLFVNGVIQPSINYTIERGSLTLEVKDAPLKKAPILVKFVSIYI